MGKVDWVLLIIVVMVCVTIFGGYAGYEVEGDAVGEETGIMDLLVGIASFDVECVPVWLSITFYLMWIIAGMILVLIIRGI